MVRLLDGIPLYAKKQREYDLWRRALVIWTETQRGNRWAGPSDKSEMERLWNEMKELRPFDEEMAGSNFDPFGPPAYLAHYRWAIEAFRVLKPGGHLLAFSGTRTWHRLASAVEDAGFEIRDTISWVYSTGFPKSLDVSKAIDRKAGAVRSLGGQTNTNCSFFPGPCEGHDGATTYSGVHQRATLPVTEDAQKWSGYGTVLKPAHEPIVVARKPLIGTVEENVRRFGTGALNIEATKVGYDGGIRRATRATGDTAAGWRNMTGFKVEETGSGRWPPNLLFSHDPGCRRVGTKTIPRAVRESVAKGELSGGVYGGGKGPGVSGMKATPDSSEEIESYDCVSGCPVAELDQQSGIRKSGAAPDGLVRNQSVGIRVYGGGKGITPDGGPVGEAYGDEGGASRFFPAFGWDDEERSFVYVPKASRSEREAGCEDLPSKRGFEAVDREEDSPGTGSRRAGAGRSADEVHNAHPTVKPIALMRWLCRLVTPKDGVVLDPFVGSGTTGVAARVEQLRFIGIDAEPEYLRIADARIRYWEGRLVYEVPRASVQKNLVDEVSGTPSLEDEW